MLEPVKTWRGVVLLGMTEEEAAELVERGKAIAEELEACDE